MTREIVTLNIEDTCLRLMVVRGKEVQLAITQPLEAGLVKNGAILDRAKASQAIRELLQGQRVRGARAIVAISGINAFYRLVSLPPVPAGVLGEAVRREAERVMPVSLLELHLSHQVLTLSNVEAVMCLVGLSRNPGEAQVETLRMAGLAPRIMDMKPLAMARAVNEPEGILVDVQEATFDIVLVVEGLPQIVRSLSFPRPGLPLSERATAVAEELDRTVKFYNSAHKGRPLQATMPLFVSGELDEQGEELLRRHLGYEVKPLPAPPITSDGLDMRRYLVNVGLALKVTNKGNHLVGTNLNVLPEVYLPGRRPREQLVALAFIPMAIAALIGVSILVNRAREQTQALEAVLAQTEQALQVRQNELAVLAELDKKTAVAVPLAEAWEQVLTNLKQNRLKVSQELSQAITLTGQPVTFDAVSYANEGSLSVKGAAPTKDEVLAYAQRLKDSRGFSETLVKSIRDRPGGVEFTLELK